MFRHDEDDYKRWHEYGRRRGWFDRARDEIESWFGGDKGAQQFHDDSRFNRGEQNRAYNDYMEGSQARNTQGPVNRWRLGGTEWGEYGTRPADRYEQQQRGNHYGRGPKGYQRTDERIREDIVERLHRHHDIDASDIEVEVSGGEVTLKGIVDTRWERRLAEDIADDVFGVKNVQNLIKVSQMMSTTTDRPNPSAGENVQPRTEGGIMGTTPSKTSGNGGKHK